MAHDTKSDKVDQALQTVDPAKRAFLKALVVGTAFGAPLVFSFSSKGISTYDLKAAAAAYVVL